MPPGGSGCRPVPPCTPPRPVTSRWLQYRAWSSVDAAKYRSFLGINPDKGEEVATASAGLPAQAPKDSAAMKTKPPPAETTTGVRGAKCPPDPERLCEVLGQMNNSLEHLERGYFNCFHETVKATWEVLADINEGRRHLC